MTFHAGNGITLTKEEENLPEEERQKIIRAKEEANRQADENLERSLGGAREYYKDDNYSPLSNEQVDSAIGLIDELYPKDKKSAAPATSGSGTVQSTGTYGTLKNEDFSAYRAQRDAERKRNWEAIRAGRQAEADKRDELLATGRFFDDGRGNIKMKKEYRRQGVNGKRSTARHFNKDTEHNTYADATNRMIKAAGQAAFGESVKSWDDALRIQEAANSPMNKRIAGNREEMKRMVEEQKAQDVRNAESNLGIFDGVVAAFDDMKNGGRIENETVFGGKDAQGRDGRWKYDAQGRVVGQAEPRMTGRKIRVGYLAKGQIQSLNNELEQFGSNMRISGITARQVFNPDFPDKEVSKPMLYVQGVRLDPASGKSVPFGEVMTMDKLYKMGLSNAQKAGGFYASTHSEDAIIDRLGDIFGVRKRKEEATMRDPKYRESVAKARLAEWKADNPSSTDSMSPERLEIEKAKLEQRKAEEEGRNARYGAKGDIAKVRAALTASKDLNNLVYSLGLSGEKADAFKASLANIITGGLTEEGGGKAPVKSGDNSDVKAPTIQTDGTLKMPGLSTPIKSGEKFQMPNGKWYVWDGKGADNTNFEEVR